MKVVFDENFFDEIDHFHPNFDESVPNPQSQGSVKVSTASPEYCAKRDVTAFDEQGPRERSFIVREFCSVWSSWHH